MREESNLDSSSTKLSYQGTFDDEDEDGSKDEERNVS